MEYFSGFYYIQRRYTLEVFMKRYRKILASFLFVLMRCTTSIMTTFAGGILESEMAQGLKCSSQACPWPEMPKLRKLSSQETYLKSPESLAALWWTPLLFWTQSFGPPPTSLTSIWDQVPAFDLTHMAKRLDGVNVREKDVAHSPPQQNTPKAPKNALLEFPIR